MQDKGKREVPKEHIGTGANEVIKAYKRLFKSPDGQIVLDDLRASFAKNCFNPDPNVTNYQTGQRSVVDLIETTISKKEE